MFSLNGLGEYEARLGGITFVCDEADSASEKKHRLLQIAIKKNFLKLRSL